MAYDKFAARGKALGALMSKFDEIEGGRIKSRFPGSPGGSVQGEQVTPHQEGLTGQDKPLTGPGEGLNGADEVEDMRLAVQGQPDEDDDTDKRDLTRLIQR